MAGRQVLEVPARRGVRALYDSSRSKGRSPSLAALAPRTALNSRATCAAARSQRSDPHVPLEPGGTACPISRNTVTVPWSLAGAALRGQRQARAACCTCRSHVCHLLWTWSDAIDDLSAQTSCVRTHSLLPNPARYECAAGAPPRGPGEPRGSACCAPPCSAMLWWWWYHCWGCSLAVAVAVAGRSVWKVSVWERAGSVMRKASCHSRPCLTPRHTCMLA